MSKVYFICDEAAALEEFEPFAEVLDMGRGFGLRLHLYYQNPAQAKKNFPNGQDVTALGNTTQIFFAVNDNSTADLVSTRLGERTVVVDSGGTSGGTSHQWSQGMHSQVSGGHSYNSNRNWNQQALRVAKPEEVMTLPRRTAITFVPGMPPVRTTLARYYEEKHLGRSGWLSRFACACATLLASIVFCACAVAAVAALTDEFTRSHQASFDIPMEVPNTPRAHRLR
jgi:type IV secretion system protein VirD4